MSTIKLRDWRDPNEPPSPGQSVIVLIRYGQGKYRRIRGMHLPAFWLEADENADSSDFWLVDPETDEAWYPQGWYESTAIDPTLWYVDESDVIAWMPLPDLPPDVGNP